MATGPNQARIILSADDQTAAAFAAVNRNFEKLHGQVEGIKGGFEKLRLVAELALAAFAVEGRLELLDNLDKLSQKTGLSVEKLSELRYQGQLANVPLDELAKGVARLSKEMASAAGGNKDATATFAALGINVKNGEGGLKSLDGILGEVADKFASYEDGAAKSALAQRLFGKTGADLIPLLNAGSEGLAKQRKEAQDLGIILGGDVARNASEFNDNLTRLKLTSEAAAISIGGQLLPALNKLLDNFLEFKKNGQLGTIITDAAKDVFGLGHLSDDPNADLKSLAREREGILKDLAFAQKKGFGTRDLEASLALNDKLQGVTNVRMRAQMKRIEEEAKRLENFGFSSGKTQAPIPDSGGGDRTEEILKRELQARLKAITDFAELQKVAIDMANQLATDAYEAGFSDIRRLFAEQDEDLAAEHANQLKALQDTIAAQKAILGSTGKEDVRIQARGAIADAQSKIAKADAEYEAKVLLSNEAHRKAVQKVQDAYDSLGATILSLGGKTREAAQVGIDQQVREAAIKIGQQPGGDASLVTQLRSRLELTADLADVQKRYGLETSKNSDIEAALALTAQERGTTERDLFAQQYTAREAALVQLQALAEEAQKLADALQTPEAIAAARQLALAFQKAAAEADPLLMKTRDIGRELGDAVSSAAEDSILHWKGFKSLLQSIEQDILQIILRSQVTKPLGDYLSNALGGNGQASGGGGILGRLLPSLFGSSGGAVNFGSSSAGAIDAASMDFAGWFADGGTLQPGQWGMAGENGPEPIYAGAVPLHVTPAGDGRQVQVHIVQQFAPGTDRRTIDQAALSAAQALRRAQRNA